MTARRRSSASAVTHAWMAWRSSRRAAWRSGLSTGATVGHVRLERDDRRAPSAADLVDHGEARCPVHVGRREIDGAGGRAIAVEQACRGDLRNVLRILGQPRWTDAPDRAHDGGAKPLGIEGHRHRRRRARNGRKRVAPGGEPREGTKPSTPFGTGAPPRISAEPPGRDAPYRLGKGLAQGVAGWRSTVLAAVSQPQPPSSGRPIWFLMTTQARLRTRNWIGRSTRATAPVSNNAFSRSSTRSPATFLLCRLRCRIRRRSQRDTRSRPGHPRESR